MEAIRLKVFINNTSLKGQPIFRIYIGSINFQLNEESVRASFIPFGPIKMIDLSWDAATQKHKVSLLLIVK